jgi:hypothetical protein
VRGPEDTAVAFSKKHQLPGLTTWNPHEKQAGLPGTTQTIQAKTCSGPMKRAPEQVFFCLPRKQEFAVNIKKNG